MFFTLIHLDAAATKYVHKNKANIQWIRNINPVQDEYNVLYRSVIGEN